jgi:hypothetical protein
VRDDVTTVDVLGLVKGAVACVPPSPALRADGWRRPLAIVLDALRPEAATPLPMPAALLRGDRAGAGHRARGATGSASA